MKTNNNYSQICDVLRVSGRSAASENLKYIVSIYYEFFDCGSKRDTVYCNNVDFDMLIGYPCLNDNYIEKVWIS